MVAWVWNGSLGCGSLGDVSSWRTVRPLLQRSGPRQSSCPRARARDRVGPLQRSPWCCAGCDVWQDKTRNLPCCCMHLRNLMTTFEEGRIMTCRRPRFSALEIVLRQSASTDIRTIWWTEKKEKEQEILWESWYMEITGSDALLSPTRFCCFHNEHPTTTGRIVWF